MPTAEHGLGRALVAGYGVGAVGTAAFSVLPGLLLLFYLTDVRGVPATLAAVALLVPKVWDVVVDPVLGALSDRTASRTGTRAPWMLTGALLLPVLFAVVFAAPELPDAGVAAWVAVTFVLAATAYSFFQVSYIALPAEMTEDAHERTRLMGWRMVLMTIGILLAGGAGPALADAAGGDRDGYLVMAAAMGSLMGVAMLTATAATRRVRSRSGAEGLTLREQFRRARGNRPFFLLLAAYVLQSLAVGAMLAGTPYIATYLLDDTGLTSVLFVALVGPALVTMPVWVAVSRRIGKVACYVGASAGFAVVALSMGFTAWQGRTALVVAQAAALGACYAAMQLLPFAMLPDTIAADEARTGDRQAGAFTGLWTAGETAGAALGPAVYALVLAVTGFVASDIDDPVAQPDSALAGVLLGFTALPALLLVVSLPLLRHFRPVLAPTGGTVEVTP